MGFLNKIISNESAEMLSQFASKMGGQGSSLGGYAKQGWNFMNSGTTGQRVGKWGAAAGIYGAGAMGMRAMGNQMSSDPAQRNLMSVSPLYNSKSEFDIAGIPFI
jgi:hypothetical protein